MKMEKDVRKTCIKVQTNVRHTNHARGRDYLPEKSVETIHDYSQEARVQLYPARQVIRAGGLLT